MADDVLTNTSHTLTHTLYYTLLTPTRHTKQPLSHTPDGRPAARHRIERVDRSFGEDLEEREGPGDECAQVRGDDAGILESYQSGIIIETRRRKKERNVLEEENKCWSYGFIHSKNEKNLMHYCLMVQ